MTFRVLSSRPDAQEWDRLFGMLPRPDVHFSSAYGRIQETLGGKACLAVYEGTGRAIIQPFMLNEVPRTNYFDIKSMYGFGGPIGIGFVDDVEYDSGAFFTHFQNWAIQNHIVSEYCALHPLFIEEQTLILRPQQLNIQFTKNVIVIDLTNYTIADVSERTARDIRKFQRSGAEVYRQDTMPSDYMDKYNAAMESLGAEDRWKFPARHWDAYDSNVGAEWFTCGGRQLLIIGVGDTAYAHFLAGDNAGLDALLYHETARALDDLGFKYFHLGGGLTAGDSLEAFKSKFSKTRYRVGHYCRVFNRDIYDRLNEVKRHWEIEEHGRPSVSPADWFPVYRRGFV